MEKELTQFDCERIVDALRAGVVPAVHLEEFCVGRKQWLESVKHDLDFVARGASKVRFLSAPWGGGKTHFILMAREEALTIGLVVSHVELNSREAPLDRFEIIFPKIIRGLLFPGGYNLESVLDTWAVNFPYYSADEIGVELRRLSPSLDFRSALRACLMHAKGDVVTHRAMLRNVAGWLGGDSLNPELKKMGVYNSVKITNVSEIVGSFVRFILQQGYKGLVVMLDEAEAVTSLTQSRRRTEANQNIRKLLDNTDEHTGLYVMFATTPNFLTDSDKGAKSYTALWSRIHNIVGPELERISKRSIIIPLEPLRATELEELATKVIMAHSRSYGWNATDYVDINGIKLYTARFVKECDDKTVRSFIRPLVYILDQAEESKDPRVISLLISQVKFGEA